MAAERSDETIFTAVARLRQSSERLRALAPEAEPEARLDGEAALDLATGAAPESEGWNDSGAAPQRPVELRWPAEPTPEPDPLVIPADDAFPQAEWESAPETGREFEAEIELEAETDFDVESEFPPAPASAFEPAVDAEPQTESDLEPEPLPALEAEPEGKADADFEPEISPDLEAESPEMPKAPDSPDASATSDRASEPAIFEETAEVVGNDLAQPPADEPVPAESAAPDRELEAVQEKALAGLVDPEERERLVERYAPVVDLQRLPKSRPQRVLTKAKKLAEEAAKPKPATAEPPSRPAASPAGGAPAGKTAPSGAEQSSPGIDFAAQLAGEPAAPVSGAPKSPSPDSGDKAKPKKKRVSLLDSYFKGL